MQIITAIEGKQIHYHSSGYNLSQDEEKIFAYFSRTKKGNDTYDLPSIDALLDLATKIINQEAGSSNNATIEEGLKGYAAASTLLRVLNSAEQKDSNYSAMVSRIESRVITLGDSISQVIPPFVVASLAIHFGSEATGVGEPHKDSTIFEAIKRLNELLLNVPEGKNQFLLIIKPLLKSIRCLDEDPCCFHRESDFELVREIIHTPAGNPASRLMDGERRSFQFLLKIFALKISISNRESAEIACNFNQPLAQRILSAFSENEMVSRKRKAYKVLTWTTVELQILRSRDKISFILEVEEFLSQQYSLKSPPLEETKLAPQDDTQHGLLTSTDKILEETVQQARVIEWTRVDEAVNDRPTGNIEDIKFVPFECHAARNYQWMSEAGDIPFLDYSDKKQSQKVAQVDCDWDSFHDEFLTVTKEVIYREKPTHFLRRTRVVISELNANFTNLKASIEKQRSIVGAGPRDTDGSGKNVRRINHYIGKYNELREKTAEAFIYNDNSLKHKLTNLDRVYFHTHCVRLSHLCNNTLEERLQKTQKFILKCAESLTDMQVNFKPLPSIVKNLIITLSNVIKIIWALNIEEIQDSTTEALAKIIDAFGTVIDQSMICQSDVLFNLTSLLSRENESVLEEQRARMLFESEYIQEFFRKTSLLNASIFSIIEKLPMSSIKLPKGILKSFCQLFNTALRCINHRHGLNQRTEAIELPKIPGELGNRTFVFLRNLNRFVLAEVKTNGDTLQRMYKKDAELKSLFTDGETKLEHYDFDESVRRTVRVDEQKINPLHEESLPHVECIATEYEWMPPYCELQKREQKSEVEGSEQEEENNGKSKVEITIQSEVMQFDFDKNTIEAEVTVLLERTVGAFIKRPAIKSKGEKTNGADFSEIDNEYKIFCQLEKLTSNLHHTDDNFLEISRILLKGIELSNSNREYQFHTYFDWAINKLGKYFKNKEVEDLSERQQKVIGYLLWMFQCIATESAKVQLEETKRVIQDKSKFFESFETTTGIKNKMYDFGGIGWTVFASVVLSQVNKVRLVSLINTFISKIQDLPFLKFTKAYGEQIWVTQSETVADECIEILRIIDKYLFEINDDEVQVVYGAHSAQRVLLEPEQTVILDCKFLGMGEGHSWVSTQYDVDKLGDGSREERPRGKTTKRVNNINPVSDKKTQGNEPRNKETFTPWADFSVYFETRACAIFDTLRAQKTPQCRAYDQIRFDHFDALRNLLLKQRAAISAGPWDAEQKSLQAATINHYIIKYNQLRSLMANKLSDRIQNSSKSKLFLASHSARLELRDKPKTRKCLRRTTSLIRTTSDYLEQPKNISDASNLLRMLTSLFEAEVTRLNQLKSPGGTETKQFKTNVEAISDQLNVLVHLLDNTIKLQNNIIKKLSVGLSSNLSKDDLSLLEHQQSIIEFFNSAEALFHTICSEFSPQSTNGKNRTELPNSIKALVRTLYRRALDYQNRQQHFKKNDRRTTRKTKKGPTTELCQTILTGIRENQINNTSPDSQAQQAGGAATVDDLAAWIEKTPTKETTEKTMARKGRKKKATRRSNPKPAVENKPKATSETNANTSSAAASGPRQQKKHRPVEPTKRTESEKETSVLVSAPKTQLQESNDLRKAKKPPPPRQKSKPKSSARKFATKPKPSFRPEATLKRETTDKEKTKEREEAIQQHPEDVPAHIRLIKKYQDLHQKENLQKLVKNHYRNIVTSSHNKVRDYCHTAFNALMEANSCTLGLEFLSKLEGINFDEASVFRFKTKLLKKLKEGFFSPQPDWTDEVYEYIKQNHPVLIQKSSLSPKNRKYYESAVEFQKQCHKRGYLALINGGAAKRDLFYETDFNDLDFILLPLTDDEDKSSINSIKNLISDLYQYPHEGMSNHFRGRYQGVELDLKLEERRPISLETFRSLIKKLTQNTDLTINSYIMPPWGRPISAYQSAGADLENRQLRFCNRDDITSGKNLIALLKALRLEGKYELSCTEPNKAEPDPQQSEEDFFWENLPRIIGCPLKQVAVEMKRHFTLGYSAPIFYTWAKYNLLEYIFPSLYKLWSDLDPPNQATRSQHFHLKLVALDHFSAQQSIMEQTYQGTHFSQAQGGPVARENMLTQFLVILCTEEALLLVDKTLQLTPNRDHAFIKETIDTTIKTIVEREASRFSFNAPTNHYHQAEKTSLTTQITDNVVQAVYEKTSLEHIAFQTAQSQEIQAQQKLYDAQQTLYPQKRVFVEQEPYPQQGFYAQQEFFAPADARGPNSAEGTWSPQVVAAQQTPMEGVYPQSPYTTNDSVYQPIPYTQN